MGFEFLGQGAGGGTAEILSRRILAARQNALGVLHRHLLDRIHQQGLGLRYRRFGGAVHGGNQFVGLLAHAQSPHQALDLLHAFRQGNLHFRITQKSVLLAQQRHCLAGALCQGFLEAAAGVLAADVVQGKRVGVGRQQQAGEKRECQAHVRNPLASFDEWPQGGPQARRPGTAGAARCQFSAASVLLPAIIAFALPAVSSENGQSGSGNQYHSCQLMRLWGFRFTLRRAGRILRLISLRRTT